MFSQIVCVSNVAHHDMVVDVCGELHCFFSHGGDVAKEEAVRHAGLHTSVSFGLLMARADYQLSASTAHSYQSIGKDRKSVV